LGGDGRPIRPVREASQAAVLVAAQPAVHRLAADLEPVGYLDHRDAVQNRLE